MVGLKKRVVLSVAAIAFAFALCACGRSGIHNGTLTAEDNRNMEVELLPGSSDHNPRRMVYYAYDYSAFSRVDDFTVVPMATETQPDSARKDALTLTVDTLGANRRVNIDCAPLDGFLVHLRFDPGQWQVDGVGVLNPYPEGTGYVCFTDILEPGLLAIATAPVGDARPQASGHVAEVVMIPSGAKRGVSAFPAPGPNNVMAMVPFCQGSTAPPTIRCIANMNYRLDGEFGDWTSKDGVLSPGLEQQRYEFSNCTHDVKLSNFGQTLGWNVGNQSVDAYDSMNLSWTERLVGDYDNNGTVTLADITPVGTLFDGLPTIEDNSEPPLQMAQSVSFEIGNSAQSTFFKMMSTPAWRGQLAHIVESYYFCDPSDTAPSPNYVFDLDTYEADPETLLDHGLTHVKNAVDCFWDGLVRDYYNWDNSDPADGVPNAFYTFPDLPGGVPTWSAPGDTLPMHYHLNEIISGFKAWTVLSTEAGQFNPIAPPASAMQVFYQSRYGERGVPVYIDQPWDDEEGLERIRKADLSAALADLKSFELDALQGLPGTFDVIIAPYAFVPQSPLNPNGIEYGVMTRLRDVLHAQPAQYGPQYRDAASPDNDGTANDGTPNGTPPNLTGDGLVSVTNEGLIFTFSYNQGYNLDEWHQWADDGVRYALYASSSAATVWSSPPVRVWNKGTANDQYVGNLGTVAFTFGAGEAGGILNQPGTTVYLGLRLLDATGQVIEYNHPAGHWPRNETPLSYLISSFRPFGPQYRVNGTPKDDNDPADPNLTEGCESVERIGLNKDFRVSFHDADQVVENSFGIVWGSDEVEYSLYGTQNAEVVLNPALLFAPENQLDTWTEAPEAPGDIQTHNFHTDVGLAAGLWYMGIRARDPDAAALPEYYGTLQGQNEEYCTVDATPDPNAPYFIPHTGLYQAQPGGIGLDQPIIEVFPLDHAFEVRFAPAVDPPVVWDQEFLTYYCFYSINQFSRLDTLAYQVSGLLDDLPVNIGVVKKDIRFADFGGGGLPGGGYDPEKYSIVAHRTRSGSPLNPNDVYCVYVAARDLPSFESDVVASSENYAIYDGAHAYRPGPDAGLVLTTPPLDLHAGIAVGDIESDGNIESDPTGVFLVYPYGLTSGGSIGSEVLLKYHEFPAGNPGAALWNIANGQTRTFESFGPTSGPQVKLDFARDDEGKPSVLPDNFRQAMCSYCGVDQASGSWPYFDVDAVSLEYLGSGLWQESVMPKPTSLPQWENATAVTALTYQSYVGETLQPNVRTIGWVFGDYAFGTDPIWADGRLMYYDFPNSPLLPPVQLFGGSFAFDGSWPSNAFGSDIVARSLGIYPHGYGAGWFPFMTAQNTRGNAMFYLANTLLDPFDPNIYGTPFQRVQLYGATNPSAFGGGTGGFTGPVDLASILPDLGGLPAAPLVGPNSLDVARSLTTPGDYFVYVAYNNGPTLGDHDPGTGLNVAYGVQHGGQLASSFTADNAHLVDGEYSFAAMAQAPNDQVDLRVMPGRKNSNFPMQGLGCVAISNGRRMNFHETIGQQGTLSWNPEYSGSSPLEDGKIAWAKLAYLPGSQDVPYILYSIGSARLPDPDPDKYVVGYEIKLWRRGGWD
jgi:hypothetical protein